MRVQIFSDIHGDLEALERAVGVEADIYIAAGDLVTWPARLDDCGKILARLGGKLWAMPGNNETDEQIAEFCAEYGFCNFHDTVIEVAGTHFAGLGYSNPTPFDTPGEYSEQELGRRLARFAALRPLALVCHAPPLGSPLDESAGGNHFGSSAVRAFLDAHAPAYFFCGHIHEAAGRVARMGSTLAANVGKKGYLLELAGGRPRAALCNPSRLECATQVD